MDKKLNALSTAMIGAVMIAGSLACSENVVLHEGQPGGDDGGGASGGDDGQAGAGNNPAPEPELIGAVTLSVSNNGTGNAIGTAYFDRPFYDCEIIEERDGCAVQSCLDVDGKGGDAGGVRIHGGLVDITLNPDASYLYSGNSNAVPAPGQIVTFSIAGSAEVPAAELEVAAVGFVQNFAPALDAITVSRAAGFPVSWNSDGGGGTVTLYFEDFSSPGTASISMGCSAPNDAGELWVPGWALSALPSDAVTLLIAQSASAEQIVGDWRLHAGVSTTGDVREVTLVP